MKAEPRYESALGTWEGFARFKPQGTTFFATALSGFLLIMIGLPVAMVVLMSLRTGFPGESVPFTLENFAEVYLTPRTYEILLNTVFFAVASVSVTLLIAVPLVWILMRTDIPFKKTIYVLLTIGILIPVFLRTIAWILLLSPRIGLLNKWLQSMFALESPPFNLYSLVGMAFVQGVSFVPGAFFMLAAAYRSMDPSLEEAAYTSGVGKLRTFLRINIPITWPAIAAVMVYLFMTAIAVFEVPAILGCRHVSSFSARSFLLRQRHRPDCQTTVSRAPTAGSCWFSGWCSLSYTFVWSSKVKSTPLSRGGDIVLESWRLGAGNGRRWALFSFIFRSKSLFHFWFCCGRRYFPICSCPRRKLCRR
jgi:ABC-type spermidine/putrescine transport system permease subunit I